MEKINLYIGTYTTEVCEQGKNSEGIYTLSLEYETGEMKQISVTKRVINPSYLCLDQTSQYLYCVNELSEYEGKKGGLLSSFQIGKETGELIPIDKGMSLGEHPCHIATDTSNLVYAANYTSGSICCYIAEEGRFRKERNHIVHSGSSINEDRQKEAHAHACIVSPDQKYLYVMDLGMDKIAGYPIQPGVGLKEEGAAFYSCTPGSGPRYGEFHPKLPFFYVIHELSSEISIWKYQKENGELTYIDRISTLKNGVYLEGNTGSDLHISPNGKYLYASNRGEDSIALYDINQNSGMLTYRRSTSSGGKTPRNFVIEPKGKYLIAGNQNSDIVAAFRIDAYDGTLTKVSDIKIPMPVCVLPLRCI